MLLIGLTGGIATGKSSVSSIISSMNLPIIDADLLARQVVEPNKPAYNSILSTFGPSVLLPSGHIDRKKLASIVFNDPVARKKLNTATHPDIRREMLLLVLHHFLRLQRACVLDTPLLFEAGLHKFVHEKVVVYCPEQTQLARLIARDNLTPTEAQSRISSQMPIDQKRSLASILIDNSNSKEDTQKQVEQMVARTLPSKFRTVIVWSLLCVPAALLYGLVKGWETCSGLWARIRARDSIRGGGRVHMD
ncbi:hypothetical protein HK097_009529 [Rhizophlyctis rosea]|uniref:Dephospho-CoA kinase n=1 Tax=Rhizophlyctis rosea TaxID=64517 RepID=A0AAD5S8U0_9FUNG|nr:hypothetical protein HK097_009529 [Rhizophlyctis rosea]